MMFTNANEIVKRIDADLVCRISDYLNEEGIDIYEDYNNSYGLVNNKYYALQMKNITQLVMINKEHLDAAGLEIPTEWTWDEYRDYAKAMTTDDHYGSYIHTWHYIMSALKLYSKPEETAL